MRGKGGLGLGKVSDGEENEVAESHLNEAAESFIKATKVGTRLDCNETTYVLRTVDAPQKPAGVIRWPNFQRKGAKNTVLAAIWTVEPPQLIGVTFITESEIGSYYANDVDVTPLFEKHARALEYMGANFELIVTREELEASCPALCLKIERFLQEEDEI